MSLFQLIPPVLAQGIQDSVTSVDSARSAAGIKDFGSLSGLIVALLKFALGFLAILAVVVMIYAGFKYITSEGDEKKAADAKHVILYAIIGIVIIGGAELIVNAIIKLI